jgi:hypothetical protein
MKRVEVVADGIAVFVVVVVLLSDNTRLMMARRSRDRAKRVRCHHAANQIRSDLCANSIGKAKPAARTRRSPSQFYLAARTFACSVWTPATTDTRQIDIPSIPSPCLTPPSPTSPPARSAAAPSRTLSPANTPFTCTRGYVQFDEVHGWLRCATTPAVRALQHRTED